MILNDNNWINIWIKEVLEERNIIIEYSVVIIIIIIITLILFLSWLINYYDFIQLKENNI